MTRAKQSDPSAALDALVNSAANKSKAALLRPYLPKITAAQNAGVPQSEIVRVLKDHGIDISINLLRNYLARERKKLDKKTVRDYGEIPQQPQQETASHVEDTGARTTDPSAIDKIVNSTPDLDALAKIHRNQRK